MQTTSLSISTTASVLGCIRRQIDKVPKHRSLYQPIYVQLMRAYQILLRMEKQLQEGLPIQEHSETQEALYNCVQQYKSVVLQVQSDLRRYGGRKTSNYLRSVFYSKKRIEIETDYFLIELKKLFNNMSSANGYCGGQECIQCGFKNVHGSRFCGYCDARIRLLTDGSQRHKTVLETTPLQLQEWSEPCNQMDHPEIDCIKLDALFARTCSSTSFSCSSKDSYHISLSDDDVPWQETCSDQLLWVRNNLRALRMTAGEAKTNLLRQLHQQIKQVMFELVSEDGILLLAQVAAESSQDQAYIALQILQFVLCESDYWMDDHMAVVHALVPLALQLGLHHQHHQERFHALTLIRALLEICEVAALAHKCIIKENGGSLLLCLLKDETSNSVRKQVYDILYLLASSPSDSIDPILGKETKNFGAIDAELPDGSSSLTLLQSLRTGTDEEKLNALELLQYHAGSIAYDLIVLYAGINQLLETVRSESDAIKQKAIHVLLVLGARDAFYREKLLATDSLTIILDLVRPNASVYTYRICHDFVLAMLNISSEQCSKIVVSQKSCYL